MRPRFLLCMQRLRPKTAPQAEIFRPFLLHFAARRVSHQMIVCLLLPDGCTVYNGYGST